MKKLVIISAVLVISLIIILLHPWESGNVGETSNISGMQDESVARTFYVSAEGDDTSGTGKMESPWKTIGRASLEMKAGDTCIIREGTYRETITPKCSGTQDKPVRYKAYPGEKVVISCTEPIGNWTKYSGQIYKTSLPWDLNYENQFIINGETLWEARWPNLSEYTMDGFKKSMAKVDSGTPDSITDPMLNQADGYWTGATLWCRGGAASNGLGAWLAQTSKVTGFDPSSHKITFNAFRESYEASDPVKNNEYYLFGLLSLLDSPGEWYVDRENSLIYLMAPDGKEPSGIEMKKRITAIDISGKSYIEIDGINTLSGNINMDRASRCKLLNMDMKWLDYSSAGYLGYDSQLDNGILITGDYNEVRNCTLEYSTGSALRVCGSDNVIVNNYFHDIDYSASDGGPINLTGDRNLISHNTIKDTGRFCIKLGGCENLVQYNDMSKYMMLSNDGAAVYAFTADGGNTRVHHNKIHDTVSSFACGIYLDNHTENFIVDHNVIYNIAALPFQLNTPQNYNLIYNNSSYNTSESTSFWGRDTYINEWYGDRILNNIFVTPAERPDTTGEYVYGSNIEPGTDPGYEDPASGDFHLKEGSLAIDKGAVIPGITDGYKGTAPDIGAYEYGGDD